MTTFITTLDTAGDGPRVAVKDNIDVAGVRTTCGSAGAAAGTAPAQEDAACVASVRAAGGRVVGKTNLHELALLPLGTNGWFGTPVNPLDPGLIPGGSSSGSAVAVATGAADVALGTDTGGSVRIPAACCGVAGLMATRGSVPMRGVRPLAPSLDTVGVLAPDVTGLGLGLSLLGAGGAPVGPARRVGRLRSGADADIERAVDDALTASGLQVEPLDWDGLATGMELFSAIYFDEILSSCGPVVAADPAHVGADVLATLEMAASAAGAGPRARAAAVEWSTSLRALFDVVDVLALPTLAHQPPRLTELAPETFVATITELSRLVAPFNVAGLPASTQPVPAPGPGVAGLQLVAPPGGEALLVATAAVVERR